MTGGEITAYLTTAALSSVLSSVGTVLVLKANMAWHKEKLDRHSVSLKNAFEEIEKIRKGLSEKHDEQQRDIHRLEVELYRRLGEKK